MNKYEVHSYDDTDTLTIHYYEFANSEEDAIKQSKISLSSMYGNNTNHTAILVEENIEVFPNPIVSPKVEIKHLSWIFDDELGVWKPPIPYPQDGKPYRWDEPTVSWIEIVT